MPMYQATRDLEAATWAAAEGRATPEQLEALESDPAHWRLTLDRLLDDTESSLASVRRLDGVERELAEADFAEDLARLRALDELLSRPVGAATTSVLAEMTGEVRLQASWAAGQVVVWAAGPGAPPADNDELADRLEAIGGPALGWSLHAPVALPSGQSADAVSIPVRESLGWLVAAGAGTGRSSVGASVVWLGRVALLGVSLVTAGAVVPTLRSDKRTNNRSVDAGVRWAPALVSDAEIERLVTAMPGPVVAISRADARSTTLAVLDAVVDAIVSEAAGRVDLPAPPPVTTTTAAVAEAVATRLDGSTFRAPLAVIGDVSRRLDQWTRSVTSPSRPKLVVQLDPPDQGGAWFLSVLGPGAKGRLLPIEQALADTRATRPLADELVRLERLFPVLMRPALHVELATLVPAPRAMRAS